MYRKTINIIAAFFLTIACICALFFISRTLPPSEFTSKTTVTLKEGLSLSEAAITLEKKHIIKSGFFYKLYVVLLGGSKKVRAGDYLFSDPQNAFTIAYRTVTGDMGREKLKVTIPEGLASYDIGKLLEQKIPNFNRKEFIKLALPKEGKLFPDTYFFYAGITATEVVDAMTSNFERVSKPLTFAFQSSSRSFDDVIRMASIIEEEASSTKDRKIISGILWKRIDNKYPLQVDAPFFYTLGKTSAELTRSDLASDSPYNLYVHKGLPPTPISNPGLDAIRAALDPTESEYWFYLSDRYGNMHYAENHDGHIANREKYIQ